MEQFVLAGDVGGTKTDLAIYAFAAQEPLRLVRRATFESRVHAGLAEMAQQFLASGEEVPVAAAFGAAGPVLDDAIALTNLPWRVERADLAARLGIERVRLLNDLETTGLGALELPADRLHTLNPGVARAGHRAVIAAGTGLGQSILFWDGARHHPIATEGGHVRFAPRDARELELLSFLAKRHGRVSIERVVSGPGLVALVDFLRTHGRTLAPEVDERLRHEDPGAVVGDAALRGVCATCEEAVGWFVSLYGAQAGQLALSTLSLGGVYVGGGIAVHLLPALEAGGFLEAFVDGGRFGDLLRQIPLRVILDPSASRLGAAEAARALTLGA